MILEKSFSPYFYLEFFKIYEQMLIISKRKGSKSPIDREIYFSYNLSESVATM
ncbi:hypothetical protein LSS_19228 [Leptospira santarosai serovar Shermani str. LT 821]|uniref:Uncharacterized protein n=1 Tax=Leptospira santarosai serovar Shermani str. LT 821 TaxID=758847 RepID=K8XW37_9LEPT|nr:hypothetical protein LSS_19228 [Leptospira santarosai serovar Shermani str. LT 821]